MDEIKLPHEIKDVLENAHSYAIIGIRHPEDGDGPERQPEVMMAGHRMHLHDTALYHQGMATLLLRSLHAIISNTSINNTMIKIMQERAVELDGDIEDYMDQVSGKMVDPQQVIHDLTGLLGSCMGQFRALAGLKREDPDDLLSVYNLEELKNEAATDPELAAAADAADADDDESGSAG